MTATHDRLDPERMAVAGDSVGGTHATRAAIAQAISVLRGALYGS